MTRQKYVALLRGINVGGNNVIPMAKLRAAFEGMGFDDVVTYIASGNVVFATKATPTAKLTKKIATTLSKAFDYESTLLVISAAELEAVVREAPPAFGKEPAKYRYDVLFVMPPMTAKRALPDVPTRAGVDETFAGTHALYFRRLIAKATQSKLAKITSMPLYKSLTVRNWNTTTKLLALVTT